MDGFNCLKATATSRRQFTSYHTIYIIAISFIIPLENDISFICIQNSFNAEFVQWFRKCFVIENVLET